MPKPVREAGSVDYEEMNHTELVQMAQFCEIPGASAACTREELIHAIQHLESLDVVNPVDKIRRRLAALLSAPGNWGRFQMQVSSILAPVMAGDEPVPSDAKRLSDMGAINLWNHNKQHIT